MLLFQLCAPAQTLSAFRAEIRLVHDGKAGARVELNGREVTSLFELRKSSEPLTQNGVSISAVGDTIRIQSSIYPIHLEASAISGVRLEIPPRASAEVELGDGSARIAAPPFNPAPLELSFSDHASARMFGGSTARLEVFTDRTYSLYSLTNVTAVTADGEKLTLSQLRPFFVGGELKTQSQPGRPPRFIRATPVVEIQFSGGSNKIISVQSSEVVWTLSPGQERQLTFGNGSKLLLRHDAVRGSLRWEVVRGVFQFKVTDFSCWKGWVTSGQSGYLEWNHQRKVIDFSSAAETAFQAQLSGRIRASILPGAHFQYAQLQDCGSYVAGATGGEVFLVDQESGEVTPIQQQSAAFKDGERASLPDSARVRQIVTLLWPSEARVELRAATSIVPVASGAEENIRLGKDELHASYSITGGLILSASAGNFEVRTGFLPEFALQIPEGGAVLLDLNRRRSLLTARAATESSPAIRVIARGQTYMFLSGAAKVRVNLGQASFMPEASASWIFFEGAGGENGFTSTPLPAPVIRPDRFDASRIFQQPVSVIE
ncbi:MAG TPA: hypothetical protein VK633_01065 [Verrucomicrobiae bacterium]|nr:hypothetical protein [Verrucomicrobiae bacterium]